jgi:hypothetical protein
MLVLPVGEKADQCSFLTIKLLTDPYKSLVASYETLTHSFLSLNKSMPLTFRLILLDIWRHSNQENYWKRSGMFLGGVLLLCELPPQIINFKEGKICHDCKQFNNCEICVFTAPLHLDFGLLNRPMRLTSANSMHFPNTLKASL